MTYLSSFYHTFPTTFTTTLSAITDAKIEEEEETPELIQTSCCLVTDQSVSGGKTTLVIKQVDDEEDKSKVDKEWLENNFNSIDINSLDMKPAEKTGPAVSSSPPPPLTLSTSTCMLSGVNRPESRVEFIYTKAVSEAKRKLESVRKLVRFHHLFLFVSA